MVVRAQEGEVRATEIADVVERESADLLIWTRTKGLADSGGAAEERHRAVARVRALGVPSLSVHLDRWHGLRREVTDGRPFHEDAFFHTDWVATADGGHDRWWEDAGVNHVWFPPGVYHAETDPGTPRDEYRSPIAFVGSWQGYAHTEWVHRRRLVHHLQRKWGDKVAFWPKRGEGAIRGRDLQDLYASVDVAVGDSCLVPCKDGAPIRAYASDRVPETLGRGAYLIHPHVEGVTDGTLWTAGEHLACWPLGDFRALDREIERALDDRDHRVTVAMQGYAHTLAHHTYRERMKNLLPLVMGEKTREDWMNQWRIGAKA